jgi:tryptophan-rich sensory protein
LTTPYWPVGLAFTLGAPALGFLPAILTFALRDNPVESIGLDQVPLPGWFFTGVWVIIYPCMGVAAWQIYAHRLHEGTSATVALIVIAATLVQTTSFWLTSSLQMTAMIDATGALLAAVSMTTAFLVGHGGLWLIPLMIWMPATLTLKLVTLHRAASGRNIRISTAALN